MAASLEFELHGSPIGWDGAKALKLQRNSRAGTGPTQGGQFLRRRTSIGWRFADKRRPPVTFATGGRRAPLPEGRLGAPRTLAHFAYVQRLARPQKAPLWPSRMKTPGQRRSSRYAS